METFRRFLSFVGAMIVVAGVLCAIFAIAQGLVQGDRELVEISLLHGGLLSVTALGAAFGFLAGFMGFWIMYLMRRIQIWRFRIVAIGVALALDFFIFAFISHGDVSGWHLSWPMFLFPLAPMILSAVLFERLALRYIRVPKLTHH